MDKSIIEKYKAEMLKMYGTQNRAVPVQNIAPEQTEQSVEPHEDAPQTSEGKLIAIVTSVRGLYPVANAKITVFTGSKENMSVIDTDVTDQSGRSKAFVLATPEKSLSMQSGETSLPYAMYNMLVEADGYVDNIHINIPVFSGVTSLQKSNMLLRETAGTDKSAQVFDEKSNYDL